MRKTYKPGRLWQPNIFTMIEALTLAAEGSSEAQNAARVELDKIQANLATPKE